MTNSTHRGTIFQEQALILAHEAYDGDQYVLRLQAPKCAANAMPGQFAHLTTDPQRPLRRPISIMRVSADQGWVDFLYKVVGEGTRLLSQRQPGQSLSVLGPIGRGFNLTCSRPLLIGGGVGMPPMIFAADRLRENSQYQPLVILGSEVPFPFTAQPSRIMIPGMPAETIAAMPLLEDWGIPSRLASLQGYPGVHHGYVTDLAKIWLDQLDREQRNEVGIYACGPHPMLEAVVEVAKTYELPVEVSLEEFMACGIGGCAGCTVEVATEDGPLMKRVCVDGPVFNGLSVF